MTIICLEMIQIYLLPFAGNDGISDETFYVMLVTIHYKGHNLSDIL